MKQIIFVCTGNTCRSPMAEMIMKDLLKKANINTIKISSRGLNVFEQSPINPHVKTILAENNINLSSHFSALLSEDDLTDDTLILTMTNSHKQLALNHFPLYSDQIFTLSEYVTDSGVDIQDPYGGNIYIYKDCFSQLHEFLTILVEKIINQT